MEEEFDWGAEEEGEEGGWFEFVCWRPKRVEVHLVTGRGEGVELEWW